MIRWLKDTDTRYDDVYVGFLSRIIQIDNFIKSEYGVKLTPRQLDGLLLNYQGEMIVYQNARIQLKLL